MLGFNSIFSNKNQKLSKKEDKYSWLGLGFNSIFSNKNQKLIRMKLLISIKISFNSIFSNKNQKTKHPNQPKY
ncbi:hypothetical protein H1P_2960006 [Hyella patelloides LEGE 07179]|uniref:Uncharacterized protein n=1 Tax=Hyella patelloides LEGE 07179 TaxID=945734 RepID=A0A563VU12_9CYAN|nr:hypothetical protein H1P_2950006 [Hyella patelloides LEGE 07179]VEP14898.1 hypothetical protein H1P_2960006 [Hyella patelloides LEGE 07179]